MNKNSVIVKIKSFNCFNDGLAGALLKLQQMQTGVD